MPLTRTSLCSPLLLTHPSPETQPVFCFRWRQHLNNLHSLVISTFAPEFREHPWTKEMRVLLLRSYTRVIGQISKRKCHSRILASPRVKVSLLFEYVGGFRWVDSGSIGELMLHGSFYGTSPDAGA